MNPVIVIVRFAGVRFGIYTMWLGLRFEQVRWKPTIMRALT